MPSSVSIFNVTKLRPGEVTLTVALVIFIATGAPTHPRQVRGSLVYSAGQESAIDSDNLAGDIGGCLRRKKDRGAGQFVGVAKAPHRNAHVQFFAARS